MRPKTQDFLQNKMVTKDSLQVPMTKDKIEGTMTKDKTLKTKSEEYLNYKPDMNLDKKTTSQDQGHKT